MRGKVRRLKVTHEESHPRLSIDSKSYHQAIYWNNDSNPGRSARKAPPIFKNYYIPTSIVESTNSSVARQAKCCEENSAVESCKTVTYETSTMTLVDLRKVHEQLDHASLIRMESFFKEAGTWKGTYELQLGAVIHSCLCKNASHPGPRPVCSLSPIPRENQNLINLHWNRLLRLKTFFCIRSKTEPNGPKRDFREHGEGCFKSQL